MGTIQHHPQLSACGSIRNAVPGLLDETRHANTISRQCANAGPLTVFAEGAAPCFNQCAKHFAVRPFFGARFYRLQQVINRARTPCYASRSAKAGFIFWPTWRWLRKQTDNFHKIERGDAFTQTCVKSYNHCSCWRSPNVDRKLSPWCYYVHDVKWSKKSMSIKLIAIVNPEQQRLKP